MIDKITETYLKDFQSEFNLEKYDKSLAFEQFINYCILSRIHPEPFDFEEVNVGGGNDSSIDGIATLVNDHIVTSKEDIDYFKMKLRRFDVQFIFIQSKISNKFDLGDIGNFLFGVRNFFDENSTIPINESVSKARELKDYIFESSIDFENNPICKLYYVTNGKWTEDITLNARINKEISLLEKTNLFSEIKFNPIDSQKIQNIYQSLKRKVIKEIIFERHTILPEIENIEQAYIGILPCKEYIKLICDDEGNLQRNLFYYNVRDFLGLNEVNEEIEDTIKNTKLTNKFALLNNGITIVSKTINPVGNKFKLTDYQIVNGCQTSHILHRNQRNLSENVFISIKLIATEDPELTNLIVKATNKQTQIKPEAFASLSDFHKKLEEFYSTFEEKKDQRLYYERRYMQYESQEVKKYKIVNISDQTRCFIAMFLNEPHIANLFVSELLKRKKDKIFSENHDPYPYYISCYARYVLDKLFRSNKINVFYKRFKYHMIMLFRLLADENELPYLNSKKIVTYCEGLLKILSNKKQSLELFIEIVTIIDNILKQYGKKSEIAKQDETFTNDLISYLYCFDNDTQYPTSIATVERERGTVKWFSEIRGYGFIESDHEVDIFVHYSAIRGEGYLYLEEGERVEFSIISTEKGLQAQDVARLEW
ncbi:MAG: AIPR protein [Candidatus Lokiarchaeota archaeon]|nr:AIPR protein [Candidatus Lokiarchaeota archaeon]